MILIVKAILIGISIRACVKAILIGISIIGISIRACVCVFQLADLDVPQLVQVHVLAGRIFFPIDVQPFLFRGLNRVILA